MKITSISPHIGALIENVELAGLTDDEFNEVYQAFLRHKVIFFRNQSLSPVQHINLAQRFGALESPHPFFAHVKGHDQISIIEASPDQPAGESFWHTDMTWQKMPPKCSVLHAQFVPKKGGDTLWCNMSQVWNDLPKSEKEYLRTLNVSHELHAFKDSRYDKQENDGESYADKVSQTFPPVIRKMIQLHPETNEEILFINEQFTRSVVGLHKSKSSALLSRLFAKSREIQYQVRFDWQAQSIAIWDNRATQHFAVTDYNNAPRKMHRVTVKGEL